jgi:hypothetical protein
LDFKQENAVLGTDLAIALRGREFAGLVLIRSANSSEQDAATYLATGAVDGCVGKAAPTKVVAAELAAAYHKKKESTVGSRENRAKLHGENIERKNT